MSMKNPNDQSGFKPATFRLVAQCLNQQEQCSVIIFISSAKEYEVQLNRTVVYVCEFGFLTFLELAEEQNTIFGPHHNAFPNPYHDSDWFSPKLEKKINRLY
jgi:hypothetical protein